MPAEEQAPWRAFGDELGVLFQIVDDMLDGDGYVGAHGADGARHWPTRRRSVPTRGSAEVQADTSCWPASSTPRGPHVLAAYPLPGEEARSTSCSSSAGSPRSRAQAQALVLAGRVPGHARRASRSTRTASSASSAPPRYVSRGGEKLANALDALAVDAGGARLPRRRRLDRRLHGLSAPARRERA